MEKLESLFIAGGNVKQAAAVENGTVIPQKFTLNYHDSTSGNITKRSEIRGLNICFYTHVHSSVIHYSQKMEATQASIDKWNDNQNVTSTYNGILFSLKNKEILTHSTTWMNLEGILLS